MKQNSNTPICSIPSSSPTDTAILPLSALEQQSTWKRLKTHHMDNKTNTITLKQRNNHAVSLMHISTPRVGTAHASARTRRRRSRDMLVMNDIIASPTKSSISQHQSDTQLQMADICKRWGIVDTRKLTVDEMLQFDKLTGLPNNLIRTIRSFFNMHGLPILPSEYRMRKVGKGLAYPYEVGTFNIGNDAVPFCRVTDVASVLDATIETLYNNNQLMRYPNMPTNQVQIQTQTDKGAASTKLCIQILNQQDINSVKHALPIACYEGTSFVSA
jgi:hypothetical protein